jgi:hypothetical protein
VEWSHVQRNMGKLGLADHAGPREFEMSLAEIGGVLLML